MDTLNIGFDVVGSVLLFGSLSSFNVTSWVTRENLIIEKEKRERIEWMNEENLVWFSILYAKNFFIFVRLKWDGRWNWFGSRYRMKYMSKKAGRWSYKPSREKRTVRFVMFSSLTNLDKSKANYKWIKLNCYFSQFTLCTLVTSSSPAVGCYV